MNDEEGNESVNCLFCGIADGSVGAHVLHEDSNLIAFLDIRPIREGHVQILPKRHFRYFDELPHDLAAGIVQLGQRIAVAQKSLFAVRRVAFLFTGGDIEHAHAHLVPMVEDTDITSRRYIVESDLTFASLPMPPAEKLKKTANRLRDALRESAGKSS